jgi:hypothetical protein
MNRIASLIFGMLALFFLAAPAAAQSGCQYIAPGAILTTAQWQYCFQQKEDFLGFTPINPANLVGVPPITVTPTAGVVQVGINNFTGASSLLNGAAGVVPMPLAGQQSYVLLGSGGWGAPPVGGYASVGAYGVLFDEYQYTGTLTVAASANPTLTLGGGGVVAGSCNAGSGISIPGAGSTTYNTGPSHPTPFNTTVTAKTDANHLVISGTPGTALSGGTGTITCGTDNTVNLQKAYTANNGVYYPAGQSFYVAGKITVPGGRATWAQTASLLVSGGRFTSCNVNNVSYLLDQGATMQSLGMEDETSYPTGCSGWVIPERGFIEFGGVGPAPSTISIGFTVRGPGLITGPWSGTPSFSDPNFQQNQMGVTIQFADLVRVEGVEISHFQGQGAFFQGYYVSGAAPAVSVQFNYNNIHDIRGPDGANFNLACSTVPQNGFAMIGNHFTNTYTAIESPAGTVLGNWTNTSYYSGILDGFGCGIGPSTKIANVVTGVLGIGDSTHGVGIDARYAPPNTGYGAFIPMVNETIQNNFVSQAAGDCYGTLEITQWSFEGNTCDAWGSTGGSFTNNPGWASPATLSSATWVTTGTNTGTVTFTFATNSGIVPGDYFNITGMTTVGYNGYFVATTVGSGGTVVTAPLDVASLTSPATVGAGHLLAYTPYAFNIEYSTYGNVGINNLAVNPGGQAGQAWFANAAITGNQFAPNCQLNTGEVYVGASGQAPLCAANPTLGYPGAYGSLSFGNIGASILENSSGQLVIQLGTSNKLLFETNGAAEIFDFGVTTSGKITIATVTVVTNTMTFNTGDLIINGGSATAGIATVTSGGVVSSEAVATNFVTSLGNASADTTLTIAGTGSGPWTGAVTVKCTVASSSQVGCSEPDNVTIKIAGGNQYAAQYPTSGDLMLSAGNGAVPTAYGGTSSAGNVLTALSAAGAGSFLAYTNLNTASTLVERDGSGNFSAGTITASLTGGASLDLPLTAGSGSPLTGGLYTIAGTAAAPAIHLGSNATGLYSTAVGNIAISVNGSVALDYNITTASLWTFNNNINVPVNDGYFIGGSGVLSAGSVFTTLQAAAATTPSTIVLGSAVIYERTNTSGVLYTNNGLGGGDIASVASKTCTISTAGLASANTVLTIVNGRIVGTTGC